MVIIGSNEQLFLLDQIENKSNLHILMKQEQDMKVNLLKRKLNDKWLYIDYETI